MSANEYGFDHKYMRKRMERMVRDIDRFTPDEAFTELTRMAMVAATQAGLSVTVKIKNRKDKS